MAGKKLQQQLAPRGDQAGLAAIRIWAMEIEAVMIKRYVGNAPTLASIKKIAGQTLRELHGIKPTQMSDCQGWKHLPGCECDPSI